ncbi:hypothetical protein ACH5RR_021695 [Cinchona calisaya]|uniref:Uncharacterized protein n=1 Tax=Cinchona calisaya TaxID=153742 RepID=A0ABD2ZI24_9GENT
MVLDNFSTVQAMDANCSSTDDALLVIACIYSGEMYDALNNAESNFFCYFTRDFEGDRVPESASEAYWDLSCEISLDIESSEIEANFMDSELSSFLAPQDDDIEELFPATLLETFLEATDLRKLDERDERKGCPIEHARNF